MGAQDNAELIRSGYEAFSKGDMDTVAKVFADDIRWNIGGHNMLIGTYSGQEEVFGFFGKLMEQTGGTFSLEIHDLLASDDHVVLLVKESGSRAGKSATLDEIHVWHVEDGRASEFWGIPKDQAETDAFWA